MAASLDNQLVIAISSRALFDLQESHAVFQNDGVDAYCRYQIAHEDAPLAPGPAFDLVKKLLALNSVAPDAPLIEIILISKNSADTGLRIMNSIAHHGLAISRAAFAGGGDAHRYLNGYGAHLFLSSDSADVREALMQGHAAATILAPTGACEVHDQLRIAFDGDAVLFSDESERIFKSQGLDVFTAYESASAMTPLPGGPFKAFLKALHRIQTHFPPESTPIRTALITARSAPAHERVIRTLRAWQIRIDEALFLGGLSKGEFLKAFGADLFFDDQQVHCDSARAYVATGHVPFGIANEIDLGDVNSARGSIPASNSIALKASSE